MTVLDVRHTTIYRYSHPVVLGDHRLMLRPRDSHDLRLIETNLTFSLPASVRWLYDVFGNSVAVASFAEPSAELRIVSSIVLETYAVELPPFQISPDALSYPFIYSADDRIDLGRMLERQNPDPKDRLGSWARGFVRSNPTDTSALLADLNRGVAAQVSYQSRETEGTQTPVETLDRGWGSCRDLAVLLIEAARCLGFGARIVTGYLYRPSADGASAGAIGAATTHAWADIYVPGSGWIAYRRKLRQNRRRFPQCPHRKSLRHTNRDRPCTRVGSTEALNVFVPCCRCGPGFLTRGVNRMRDPTPPHFFADQAKRRCFGLVVSDATETSTDIPR